MEGHLDHLLPARTKVQKAGHHAALPYNQIGTFMAQLRQQEGIAARALELAILTAARTSEVIGARWEEIDLEKRLWTIPGDRMKARKEHRMPLANATLAVLEAMTKVRQGDYVFPGAKGNRPLSNMALLMTLHRMKQGNRVNESCGDDAGEEVVVPSSDLAAEA